MSDNSNDPNLNNNLSDYAAAALRAVSSMVPIGGPFLSELFSAIIPNQRVDRVVDLINQLNSRLTALEQADIKEKLNIPEALELFEECIQQAARSSNAARHEHIANLLANSLTKEEISFVESKHLLNILNQLTDIEIIWLNYYYQTYVGDPLKFQANHQDIISFIPPSDDLSEIAKATLRDNYIQHLERLGLLTHIYKIDHKTNTPRIDPFTHKEMIARYEITPLGRLFIRHVIFDG